MEILAKLFQKSLLVMLNSINKKYNFKDILVILFLVIPIVSRWLLPSGIEMQLTKSILDIPFYIPNLFIFLFMLYATRNKRDKKIKIILGIHFCFSIIGILLNEYTDKISFLFAGTYYFYAMYIALNYRITESQKVILKKVFFYSLFILTLQIILYSTGVLIYSKDVTSGYDLAGIYRISTTVGAATGTAGLIFLLGCITFYLYGKTLHGFLALIFSIVSLLLLISRGGIIAMAVFLILFFWDDIKKSFRKSFAVIIFFTILFFSLYKVGLFEPILIRTKNAQQGSDITSGRLELIETSIRDMKDYGSFLFGLGTGNVYRSKDLNVLNIDSKYYGAPHNSFVLTYVEQGFAGIFLFLIFWLSLLYKIRDNKTIFYILLSFFFILLNTETVFLIDSEFVFLLSIIMMIGLDKKYLLKKYL